MTMKRRQAGLAVSVLLLAASGQAIAQAAVESRDSPRWSYEIRAGYYAPDLDLFEVFYGDDTETLYSLTGSYRFKDWLELGGEYGQMRAKGVGILTSSQALGGSVTYRLELAHIYANFVFQRSPGQRVIPYLGLGVAVGAYHQAVTHQSSSDGRTDVGYSARLGIRFLAASRGLSSASTSRSGTPWRSYAFLEAQRISIEVEDTQLGGDSYLVGFRMEFDFGH